MAAKQKITDKELIDALLKCLAEAVIPAAEVAEKINENIPDEDDQVDSRYIKDRLLEIVTDGAVICKKHGNTLFFRPNNEMTSCR